MPRRQGPVHPRNEDLSLSRPFHVGSGEIPHARKKCRRCARSTIRSSRCARGFCEQAVRSEDELKAIDAEIRAIVDRGGRIRHQRPEPDPADSTPMFDDDRSS